MKIAELSTYNINWMIYNLIYLRELYQLYTVLSFYIRWDSSSVAFLNWKYCDNLRFSPWNKANICLKV